jgi:peptidoglycan/LPS O-acetylase OafA/YrhL
MPPTTRPRVAPVDALTSMRGLAAVWVVVFHFQGDLYLLLPPLEALAPLLRLGHTAVPFFFLLSGYVLMLNYGDAFRRVSARPYLGFVGKRFARVYPVHLFTLLALLGMVLVSRRLGLPYVESAHTAPAFFLNLALMQTWVPDFEMSWNGPSWSISSEWFAYLIFPFFCPALSAIRSWKGAVVAVVAGWAASVACYAFTGAVPWHYLFIVVPTFLTGCLLCRAVSLAAGPPSLPRYLPDALLVALVVLPFPVAHLGDWSGAAQYKALIAPLFACFAGLIYAFGRLSDACSAVWRSAPLLFLGDISYSLYMTHSLVQKVTNKVLPAAHYASRDWPVRAGVASAYAALVGVAAVGTYFLVEAPARRYFARLLSGSKPLPPHHATISSP